MTTGKQKVLSLLLAALMLCMVVPASAAESVTAATMQLMKTEGTVNVTNASGRGLTIRDNMRLYNGYHVETKAKSYAWINLDSEKLIKLDAVSEGEVRKSKKSLELLLSSGSFFFNVSSPLKEGETLNVRTATMVVGIRGTSGWFKVVDRWSTEIYVLEGTVQCIVSDPVTGQAKEATIQSGEMAVATTYPQGQEGDKCDIVQEKFEPDDIDGFVLEELARDPALCASIFEKSGLDVMSAVEATQERREQDEQKMQETLDRIDGQLAEQDGSVSAGGVWDRDDPASNAPSGSNGRYDQDDGGDRNDAGSTGGDNPENPTDNMKMPLTAEKVKEYLNENDEVTLLANEDASQNQLIIDSPTIIEDGKILTLSAGIDVVVQNGSFLIVNGNMSGENNNTFTISYGGELNIGSSGTLKMQFIENQGVLTNNEQGQIETETLTTNGTFGSAGGIKGTIIQTGGTADITGGKIDGGNRTAVDIKDGTFSMIKGDGEIISSIGFSGSLEETGGSIATVHYSHWESLNLQEGKITNDGDGYVLCGPAPAEEADITIGSMLRSRGAQLFSNGTEAWDLSGHGYTVTKQPSDDYYYLDRESGTIGDSADGNEESGAITPPPEPEPDPVPAPDLTGDPEDTEERETEESFSDPAN